MKLSEVSLEDEGKQRLLQHFIRRMSCVEEFLELSLLEVRRIGCLGSSAEAADFRAEVAQRYLEHSTMNQILTITAQDLYQVLEVEARPMTSGCSLLDAALPIFVPGHVVEVAGESGCGKTQLCIQLCVAAQLPTDFGGLGGTAAYVSSESSFPTERLVDITEGMRARFPGALPQNVLDNVIVLNMLHYASESYARLFQHCEDVCVKRGVRLLVVDSIAAMFRGRSEMDDPIRRSESTWAIAQTLHSIATKGVVVVVVNQVTSVIDKFSSSRGGVGGAFNKVAPALGLSWSNAVNTRVLVTQTGISNNNGGTLKLMQLVFSPMLPLPTAVGPHDLIESGDRSKGAILYYIDKGGVHGI